MSGPLLFWADPHFDHENIIKYCDRPYKDSDHMTEELIKNYNSKATDATVGIIAGDIIFKGGSLTRCKDLIDRLNGTKILVLGNHDKKLQSFKGMSSQETYNETGFFEVCDYKEVSYTFRDGEKKTFVVFHYPMVAWNKKRYGSVHLFGHVHGQILTPLPQSLDIGVDANNYFPISPEDIRLKLRVKDQWVTEAEEL